jgi:hypothetical protein
LEITGAVDVDATVNRSASSTRRIPFPKFVPPARVLGFGTVI